MTINKEFYCVCPRCGREVETIIHALRNFPKAKDVLILKGPRWSYC